MNFNATMNNNINTNPNQQLQQKEIHNRNLTIKEVYSLFGEFMIKHNLIELDQSFNKYLSLDGISLDNEDKKLICRDISDQIIELLKQYEYVFIKLNSKAATDSEFLCMQLKCFTIDDILVLLKGSTKINLVFNPYAKNYLIIKPWYKIEHKYEFRCYFINKRLKGISQRYINLYEEYDNNIINKIRQTIIDFFFAKELRDVLDKIEIEEDKLHYMIIDVVYLYKKNKIRIIDVETLIDAEFDLPPEEPEIGGQLLNEQNKKNDEKKKKDDKKKKTPQEIQEEELLKKKMEEEENMKQEYFKEMKEKKANIDDKVKLFIWDDLLNVDDEDKSEIELRFIEGIDDDRIVPEPENPNQFPVELYENENNIEELIRKLNIK